MTTRIREAAADYQEAWHANHPEGCTISIYLNGDLPGDFFELGAEWAIAEVLKELRSESEKLGITDERRLHSEAIAQWLESRFKGE